MVSKICIWTKSRDFGHREKGKSPVTEGEHDFVILSFLVRTFPFLVDVHIFLGGNFSYMYVVA